MVAVMVITTILVSIVMLVVWQWHRLAVAALMGFLFTMEGVLLSAAMYRVRPLPLPAGLLLSLEASKSFSPYMNMSYCILGLPCVGPIRHIGSVAEATAAMSVPIWELALGMVQRIVFWLSYSVNVMQVPQGGWFPLAIAAVVLCLTAIWHWGSLLRLRHSQACSARLVEDLLQDYKERASTRSSLIACHVVAMLPFLDHRRVWMDQHGHVKMVKHGQ